MNETPKKIYDLEERTFQFAKNVSSFCKQIPKSMNNMEYSRQLVRSSASVGANYIEANEALSRKDFLMRVRISRKEAKESAFWLRLILETNSAPDSQGEILLAEAIELKKILSSMIER